MTRPLLTLCALMALLAARAEAITLPAIPLSHYPSTLTPLDAEGLLANVKVYVADTQPYASFFLEAAVVEGTLVLTDSLTSHVRQTLLGAAGDAADSVGTDPAQWPDLIDKMNANKAAGGPDPMTLLRHDADRLEQLVDALTAALEKAPGLAAQVPGLVSGLHDAYPGWKNKLQMMRTLGSLMDTSNKLKHSVVNLDHMLTNVRGIVAAVHR